MWSCSARVSDCTLPWPSAERTPQLRSIGLEETPPAPWKVALSFCFASFGCDALPFLSGGPPPEKHSSERSVSKFDRVSSLSLMLNSEASSLRTSTLVSFSRLWRLGVVTFINRCLKGVLLRRKETGVLAWGGGLSTKDWSVGGHRGCGLRSVVSSSSRNVGIICPESLGSIGTNCFVKSCLLG